MDGKSDFIKGFLSQKTIRKIERGLEKKVRNWAQKKEYFKNEKPTKKNGCIKVSE